MDFEWDENKRSDNIRRHKIDFADVPSMFARPMLIGIDDRRDYGEERWIGIGLLSDIVAVVVWVERSEHVIRIISARLANRRERELYGQYLKN
jgi:uncharacterized protein